MKPQHISGDSSAVHECTRMVKERLRQAFRATMLVDDTRNESSHAKTNVFNVEEVKRPNRIVTKNVRRIEDLMLIWRSNDRTVLSIYSYCAIRDKISLHKQDQMRPTTRVQDGEEERFRNFLRLHSNKEIGSVTEDEVYGLAPFMQNVWFSGVERGIGSLVMGIWHLKPFSSTSSHVIYLLLRGCREIETRHGRRRQDYQVSMSCQEQLNIHFESPYAT
ncbi:hypothetical protein Tco_0750930 [Tanacetum coccineum]|uniref:Uncharacterized protein n=1 Tax=Tanacetum coccineum TaxID=301880 RepID=A0ABQ4Z2N1_9ASTR